MIGPVLSQAAHPVDADGIVDIGRRLKIFTSKKSWPEARKTTVGQNREKPRMNSHLIIHRPTSEGVSEESEQANE